MQRARDLKAGLNTAGFISGYRGSPIGGYDQALWQSADLLKSNHIHFEPGLNEDLAATAVWGTQQVNSYAGAKYDGVFSIWYGKGPGVDRCGDVITYGNASGTSPHGGVLFIAGDDHGGISSTLPHQSDHIFVAAMMPILAPSNIQDILNMGMLGWELSRYSGLWVGFKLVSETLESSASVDIDPERVTIRMPDDFEMPEGGLNFRRDIDRFAQEAPLQTHKGYAALAFVASNCVSVVPLETEFGRKRAIDQYSCNKDYSCVNGFCPSFVTVLGGALRRPRTEDIDPVAIAALDQLPEPSRTHSEQPYEILIAGIGGTGVITISALLGMAAHLEGKRCSVLDMTGLSQKNGAVYAHVKIADQDDRLYATRIAAGGADLLLGCNKVAAAAFQSLSKVDSGHTRAVINQHFTAPASFVLDNDMDFHEAYTAQQISNAVGANLTEFVDASKLASALL